METGDDKEALTTLTEAQIVEISATDSTKWNVAPRLAKAEWTVTPKDPEELASNKGFDLNISSLKTTKTSGIGYLYIYYENIGNYPDGRLVVPIEKTPLLYRGGQVGIGTTDPSAKLHIGKVTETQLGLIVEGSSAKTDTTTKEVLRFVRPRVQNQANEDKVSFKLGKFEGKSDGKPQLDIALTDVTVMSLRGNGNVGIGTTSPKKELHVVGDLVLGKDEDNKKFIIHSCTTNNGDFLQITSDKPDGNWAWDQGITLKRGGKVGIGIDNPSEKLHVNGRIKDKTGWVMPVGTILPYAGTTAPEGWWLCNGDSRRKSDFGDLFEVIQYNYGGRLNDFNLPNLQGRVPVGFSSSETQFNQLGETGGSKTHTLTVNEMPSHTHGVTDPGHEHTKGAEWPGYGTEQNQSGNPEDRTSFNINTGNSRTNISIQSTGGGQPHSNLQPYITVNYIIKY